MRPVQSVVRESKGTGLLVFFLLASWTGAARAGANAVDGAAIVRGAGRLKVEGAHEWRGASTTDVLTPGITVEAAADQPLEMTLPDGVTVALQPGAVARWMPGGKLPSETNHWTHGYHLALEEGELEVRMPPAPKGTHAFLVSTKAGTLTDWRGQLHVCVHGESAAAAIYEGALVVGSNGQGFPVYDGAGIWMRRGVNPDRTLGIPASPAWEAGSGGLTLAPSEAGSEIDVAWSPVPRAAEYRVELGLDPAMDHVTWRGTTSELHLRLPMGDSIPRAWVRVRAVGSEGIVGAWSPLRPIRAVRYALPAGALVANDGVLVVPDRETVSVQNADGLELAYENVTGLARNFSVPLYWGKLSGPLRLAEEAPMRIAHLRDPVVGAEARLVLARRELVADVELGPARARWPVDAVEAHIEVRDPSGRINAAAEAVSVEAMLDLTPLPVVWEHQGARWHARIAPRPIAGNSVVRVVVRDAKGSEIGSGFLELAPVGEDPR
jgi:hypothetical protein